MKDREIIDLYWERDENAIRETARAYGGYCYAIAFNILSDREDAEECLNDTWMNAWGSIPPQAPQDLCTYLGKITRNLSLNRYKRKRAQKRGAGSVEIALSELEECIPDPIGVECIAERIVLVHAIETFLREREQTERAIFLGRYWYLYSIRDLARAYQMNENKVTSLLFRMRKSLKQFLEKEGIYL